MDVIGTSIAILQLIGKIATYTRTASGFKEDRSSLRNQLEACANVVHLLQDTVVSQDDRAWAEAIEKLAEPNQPLDRLQKALEAVEKKLPANPGWKKALVWPLKKDEVEALTKVVDQNISLLLVSLGNNSGRMLQSLDSQMREQTQRLNDIIQRVFASRKNSQILEKELAGIRTIQAETRDDIARLDSRQESRESAMERHDILNWLTDFDHKRQQHDVYSGRQDGTGEWFLDSEEYGSWKETRGQTLICPGMPGAGKTVLASIVIDERLGHCVDHPEHGIAFAYCDYKLQKQQSTNSILASLLKQLIEHQPVLSGDIKDLYGKKENTRNMLSLDDIRACIRSVISSYSRVFIVIDALDECDSEQLADLLPEISALRDDHQVNFMATARRVPQIMKSFEKAQQMEIRATTTDIQKYVEGHIRELPGFVARNLALQGDVKAKILKSADGVFLLARLHLQSLKGCTTATKVRSKLEYLNTGEKPYDQAYRNAMDRIEEQSSDQTELAKQVLAWIVYAKRSLSGSELQVALGVEIGKRELDLEACPEIDMIVSVCAGLVTIDEGARTVQLVHYTAQEFFEREKAKLFPHAGTDIAKTCTTYLSHTVFRQNLHSGGSVNNDCPFVSEGLECSHKCFPNMSQDHPFYLYAAEYWYIHAKQAPNTRQAVAELLCQKDFITRILSQQSRNRGHVCSINGLHLAARFGLDEAAEAMLLRYSNPDVHAELRLPAQSSEIDRQDAERRSPLHYASLYRHNEIAVMLLRHGANPNLLDSVGQSPLFTACRDGYGEIVDTLLRYNAKPDHGTRDKSPMYAACQSGQTGIVEELLKFGTDLHQKDQITASPLHTAILSGHVHIFNLLLQHGANPHQLDGIYATPLSTALLEMKRVSPNDKRKVESLTEIIESLKKLGAKTSLDQRRDKILEIMRQRKESFARLSGR